MASPSTTITLGFGSFGGVNLLPTLGYGIAAFVPVAEPPFEIAAAQTYAASVVSQSYAAKIDAQQARPA